MADELKVVKAAVARGIQMRNDHIEMMAAAYFQKTDIDPEEVELVEQAEDSGEGYRIRWYFRKREGARKRHKKA